MLGERGHLVLRRPSDGQGEYVEVLLVVDDPDRFAALASSEQLQQMMLDAGVSSEPQVTWLELLRLDLVWGRELATIEIRHEVADVDAWLAVYDSPVRREQHGIVGHAASRSSAHPSMIVVHHQAESREALQGFLDDPAAAEDMERAGVTSEPEITFSTSGWGEAV
jgi:hypothetical protein